MIRALCKDDKFLVLKSIEATKDDISIGNDLLDTLKHYKNSCVGMAANMIGVNKKIIAIDDNGKYIIMYNPEIKRFYGDSFIASEGCLCHSNKKETKRYTKIQVSYYNEDFKKIEKSFNGFTAEIIQHEVDHLNGILI